MPASWAVARGSGWARELRPVRLAQWAVVGRGGVSNSKQNLALPRSRYLNPSLVRPSGGGGPREIVIGFVCGLYSPLLVRCARAAASGGIRSGNRQAAKQQRTDDWDKGTTAVPSSGSKCARRVSPWWRRSFDPCVPASPWTRAPIHLFVQ